MQSVYSFLLIPTFRHGHSASEELAVGVSVEVIPRAATARQVHPIVMAMFLLHPITLI